MNSVSSAHHHRVFMLERATAKHRTQSLKVFEQQRRGVAHQQRVRGINDIRRCETVMNVARFGADVFGKRRGERNHVVTSRALDLFYAINVEARFLFDYFDGFLRDSAHLGVDFADGDLYIEPFLKSILFSPDSAHAGQRVSFNHICLKFKPLCRPVGISDLHAALRVRVKQRAVRL